ncbi:MULTISPECIES: tyrosine-protein phosphatase [Lactobacillus]|uniref:tyrosine-protein phosphatase n=1 Tax=Lactobacillus TaxID=1578 RepID=UPI00226B0DCC|nr:MULTISPECIES: tyrosine-protein phosphatase [Lactobacillus]MCX8735714.1 tyrosine-protein phosphatase [Lactobacillus sp. B4026]
MTTEITNWRSLGGYVSSDGRKVKEGLLFRCGQLFDLTDEQKDRVQNYYKIKRLVDFRGDEERQEYPDYLWSELDYEIIDVLKDTGTNQASVDEIVSANSHVEQDMLKTYEELALAESAKQGYHDFLLTLMTDPVPVAFHCFAGKDRTGVAAALILKSLDVSEEQIFTDYLKTISARKKANDEILEYLKDKMDPNNLNDVAIALTVERQYLERYFSTVKKHYGDFDHYFTDGLKLPQDFKEQMQKNYLV